MARQDTVVVAIDGENGVQYIKLPREAAKKMKKLLTDAVNDGDDYPEEVNDIIDSGTVVEIYGTVNTSGDGWGWYNVDEE